MKAPRPQGRFAPPLAVAAPALTARPLHDRSLTVALVREAAEPAAILTKAHGKPKAAPGVICHPKGRSKAEDGAAVDRSRQAWPQPFRRGGSRAVATSDD